jgi:hypothetical protein
MMAVAVVEEGLSKQCKVWHGAAGVNLSIALLSVFAESCEDAVEGCI